MSEKVGIQTIEAMTQTGLSTFRFRRIVEELKISPLKRIRGEISFRWRPEDVKLIGEYAQIFYKEKNPINELEIVEFYLKADNIHQVAKHFNRSYHLIERIIYRFQRNKGVIVESKLKDYDG